MSNQTYDGVNQKLQGFYKVGVVDPETNEVKWQSEEPQKNLILNQGMDSVYARSLVACMAYGVAGTGTRPNSLASGTSQITQSGVQIFLSNATGLIPNFTSSNSGYTSAAAVGDMLIYQNASQSTITAIDPNGFYLTVTPAYTFTTGQTFTVWKTTQVGLQTEVSRSNSYMGGTGYCGTTYASNMATHRRSYDFSIEGIAASYNEIGIAWAGSLPSTVFSRILLDPSVIVPAGFKLRIMYDLQTIWNPTSSLYATASIGGWPVAPSTTTIGTQSLQNFLVSSVDVTSGASVSSTAFLDPYYTGESGYSLTAWVSPSSASLETFGSAVNRSTNGDSTTNISKAAQVLGTYVCDKTFLFSTSIGNRTDLKSIGVGGTGGAYNPLSNGQVYAFVFDQAQSKTSLQTLSFTFRWTWGRILS